MLRIRRMTALVVGGIAVCAALLGAATPASAAPAHPTAPVVAPAAAVSPAAFTHCGFNSGGLWGTAQYENCSRYAWQVVVEPAWWWESNYTICVGAYETTALNTGGWAPRWAYADGRRC